MVGFLDKADPFHISARTSLLDAMEGGRLLLPGVAYAESLIVVLRAGGASDGYDVILSKMSIEVGACSKDVLARAAHLRTDALRKGRGKQWHLPDALIVAEAIDAGADLIVTTDRGWPKLPEGPDVKILRSAQPQLQAVSRDLAWSRPELKSPLLTHVGPRCF